MTGSSKGLAEITKSKSPRVQFIHESVRDFLIKDNGLHELWPELEIDWESSSHDKLKQCCLFYLSQSPVTTFIRSIAENPYYNKEDVANKYALLKYATQNILHHANAAAKAVDQGDFLSEFPLLSWIRSNNYFEKFAIRAYTSEAKMIYILADKGYTELIRTGLKRNSTFHDKTIERYRYPLFAALANGHKETATAILCPESTVNSDLCLGKDFNYKKDLGNYKGRTPLTWAAQEGHLNILNLLLDSGAHVNERDDEKRLALSRAAQNAMRTL